LLPTLAAQKRRAEGGAPGESKSKGKNKSQSKGKNKSESKGENKGDTGTGLDGRGERGEITLADDPGHCPDGRHQRK
jgi:hypothetical protein